MPPRAALALVPRLRVARDRVPQGTVVGAAAEAPVWHEAVLVILTVGTGACVGLLIVVVALAPGDA